MTVWGVALIVFLGFVLVWYFYRLGYGVGVLDGRRLGYAEGQTDAFTKAMGDLQQMATDMAAAMDIPLTEAVERLKGDLIPDVGADGWPRSL